VSRHLFVLCSQSVNMPSCLVRWYEGRRHAEEAAKEEGWDFKDKHKELYENIHPLQPYVGNNVSLTVKPCSMAHWHAVSVVCPDYVCLDLTAAWMVLSHLVTRQIFLFTHIPRAVFTIAGVRRIGAGFGGSVYSTS
jgi:hypothetical protein